LYNAHTVCVIAVSKSPEILLKVRCLYTFTSTRRNFFHDVGHQRLILSAAETYIAMNAMPM